MTQNTISSLAQLSARTIHKVISHGNEEEFTRLAAQGDDLIHFFRFISDKLISNQERKVIFIYQNGKVDKKIHCEAINTELQLTTIPLERIEYIAKQVPNIWSKLNQEQKNALFLAAIFDSTTAIVAADAVNNTNFELYFVPQKSANNLLKILALGADLREINFHDKRTGFDVLINSILFSSSIPDEIKEILKVLIEKNIPITSQDSSIITKGQERFIEVINSRKKQLRDDSSNEWILGRVKSLEETQQYFTLLQARILYSVVEEANNVESVPALPNNRNNISSSRNF